MPMFARACRSTKSTTAMQWTDERSSPLQFQLYLAEVDVRRSRAEAECHPAAAARRGARCAGPPPRGPADLPAMDAAGASPHQVGPSLRGARPADRAGAAGRRRAALCLGGRQRADLGLALHRMGQCAARQRRLRRRRREVPAGGRPQSSRRIAAAEHGGRLPRQGRVRPFAGRAYPSAGGARRLVGLPVLDVSGGPYPSFIPRHHTRPCPVGPC